MKRTILFFILLSLPLFLLSAQKKWTLKACIEYATEKNPENRISQLTIQSNRILADKSQLNYVPNLRFHSGYQLNMTRSLNPQTYSFIENTSVHTVDAGINLDATLFDGFRRYYTYHKSISDLDASVTDFEALKNDITVSVMLNYMNILLNKEIIHSIKRQIEISDSSIAQARLLFQEGMITDEKLQNLLIQRDNEKYALAEAEGNLTNSVIGLCSLLHIGEYESFDVEDGYLFGKVIMIPLDDIIESAMALPQIEAGEKRIRSANYSLKIARSDLYPTLSFGVFFGSNYSNQRKRVLSDKDGNLVIVGNEYSYDHYPVFSQLNNHRNGYLAFTVSYPVFNLFQTKKNIALAKNNILKAQCEMQLVKKNMKEHISKIYSEAKTAKKKYEASLSIVEHSETILSYAVNKLKNGVLTPTDYVVTKNNLMISEAQASRAKYEYFFKLELLQFYYSHH